VCEHEELACPSLRIVVWDAVEQGKLCGPLRLTLT